jgi:hypothetical protein
LAEQPPQKLDVPLAWVGYDEEQVAFANQFLVQFQPDGSFVLGIGQATAPPLMGTPEEVAQQVAQIEFVPVKTLMRVAMTEAKMRELVAALEANLRNFEQTAQQFDPRHDT